MEHHYHQLRMEEREKIQEKLFEGRSLRSIARMLRRDPATLSREIARNAVHDGLGRTRYTPRKAEEQAQMRIQTRGRRLRLKHVSIRSYVHGKLRMGWSPEQIAGRLSVEHPDVRISHEAIYQYIYAQYRRGGYGVCTGTDLRQYLRRRHKVRHPKKLLYAVEYGPIQNRTWIDARPARVEARCELGHWEGDSLVSRQGILGLNTLVERTSGLVLLSKLIQNTSSETRAVVIRRLQRIPRRLRRTLTVDNGHEFSQHKKIARDTGMDIYFAHPYHSWERGTNENTNGLVREYFPKGTDFAVIQDTAIRAVEARLNTRPRKRLHWQTPQEVFTAGVALKG